MYFGVLLKLNYVNMIASLQLDVTYDQVIALVKKMPLSEKIKLSKELENDAIISKLSKLLKTFKTKELSIETINAEVELVRQQMYESSTQ